MKKILIIGGIVLILIALGVIGYVLIMGKGGGSGGFFARFGNAGDSNEPVPVVTDTTIDVGDSSDTGVRERLRQVSDRPVAGAVVVGNTIRYVERGTGHLYDVNLDTGTETLVSGTTIPRTIEAVFGETGDVVVLTSEAGNTLTSVLGELEAGSDGSVGGLVRTDIPKGAREFALRESDSMLSFFVPTDTGGSGYAYHIETGSTTLLFTIPLSQVRILWGTPTYLYTTPSAQALGYLYRIDTGNALGYVRKQGSGLVAVRYGSGLLIGEYTLNRYTATLTNRSTISSLIVFPEKCVGTHVSTTTVYCASPIAPREQEYYPDAWYMGTTNFSDTLLRIDTSTGESETMSALERETGRPIDIYGLSISRDDRVLSFVNRYDGALWVFDLR